MTRDNKLISESYKRILEAKANTQPAPAQPAAQSTQKRVKDINSFTSNLIAIDAFEDRFNDLLNTAIKTGFFNQQEAAQAKQLIGSTIVQLLGKLAELTQINSPNQIEQMKKAISDKIKGVDVTQVLQKLDSLANAGTPVTNAGIAGAVPDNASAIATPQPTGQTGVQGAVADTAAVAQ